MSFKKAGRYGTFARILTALSMAALPVAGHASSYEPQGLNLGTSSFMDAFGGTQPGFVYIPSIQINDYNRIANASGNDNPLFVNPQITAVTFLQQFVYVSPLHLFGGALGVTGLVPLVDLNASTADNSPVSLNASRGVALADMTIGPFLQMPIIFSGGRPVFAQRFEFDVNMPTGQNDRSKAVTASAGFWSINPYYAFTVLPTPSTEVSMRIHYLHNFENSDPGGVPPYVHNYQAGDAWWTNFTASYKILPSVNFGLNGYYFKQFTDDKQNGVTVKGTETENLSMGPGAMWTINRSNMVFTNLYLPVVEKNTSYGTRVIFRWIHVF